MTSIAEARLGEGGLEHAFHERFGTDLPETLNGDHRMLIVGSGIDLSSERIIKYLSETHGVNINAATFQYFREPDGTELLARVFLIEPAEAELHRRTRGSSKRRPNLTYDQLIALAAEAGVEDLYRYAVSTFGALLLKYTTKSSIGFAGRFNGSRKNVMSLLPGESSAEDGLRYQLYKNRYRELTKLSDDRIEELMPAKHEPVELFHAAGADSEGVQGFIFHRHEIDQIADALPSQQADRSPAIRPSAEELVESDQAPEAVG